MMKKKIALLAGGFSEEREISLESSEAIRKALITLGYEVEKINPANFKSMLELGSYLTRLKPYMVFNGLHGGIGENGKIQAFLDLLDIPYTGSGCKASALAMDKITSSQIAASLNIKVPFYHVLNKIESYVFDGNQVEFPMVVKPSESGSSYGITIVYDKIELFKAIYKAFEYSDRVMCQKYVEGSELTVTILDGKALPVVEIRPKQGWYDLANKYTDGNTEYIVPAEIPASLSIKLQRDAETIFKEFGCKAYARVDFKYDGTDHYFLELNTLPGMTSLSLTPMAAKEIGLSFNKLIDKIIELSF